jgi:hypothetical protein
MRLKTNSKNKVVPFTIVFLLVAGFLATYGLVASNKSWWPFVGNSTNSILSAQDDPNTPDPTYSSTKDDPTDNAQNSPNPVINTEKTEKRTVSVALTSASIIEESSKVEIRSFVSGIIEGTGTCTATLTKGTSNVTQSSPAFIDATTSQCEPIQIDRSKFTNGDWIVTVEYNSPTSKGSSQAMTIRI